MEYLIKEGDNKPIPFSGSQLQAINEAKRMYTDKPIRIWEKHFPKYSIWVEKR